MIVACCSAADQVVYLAPAGTAGASDANSGTSSTEPVITIARAIQLGNILYFSAGSYEHTPNVADYCDFDLSNFSWPSLTLAPASEGAYVNLTLDGCTSSFLYSSGPSPLQISLQNLSISGYSPSLPSAKALFELASPQSTLQASDLDISRCVLQPAAGTPFSALLIRAFPSTTTIFSGCYFESNLILNTSDPHAFFWFDGASAQFTGCSLESNLAQSPWGVPSLIHLSSTANVSIFNLTLGYARFSTLPNVVIANRVTAGADTHLALDDLTMNSYFTLNIYSSGSVVYRVPVATDSYYCQNWYWFSSQCTITMAGQGDIALLATVDTVPHAACLIYPITIKLLDNSSLSVLPGSPSSSVTLLLDALYLFNTTDGGDTRGNLVDCGTSSHTLLLNQIALSAGVHTVNSCILKSSQIGGGFNIQGHLIFTLPPGVPSYAQLVLQTALTLQAGAKISFPLPANGPPDHPSIISPYQVTLVAGSSIEGLVHIESTLTLTAPQIRTPNATISPDLPFVKYIKFGSQAVLSVYKDMELVQSKTRFNLLRATQITGRPTPIGTYYLDYQLQDLKVITDRPTDEQILTALFVTEGESRWELSFIMVIITLSLITGLALIVFCSIYYLDRFPSHNYFVISSMPPNPQAIGLREEQDHVSSSEDLPIFS